MASTAAIDVIPSRSPEAPSSGSPSDAAHLDGQIVFEDSGQDFHQTQIWLENADGSNVRKVVDDAFTDNSASLSPDGKKIVFGRGFTDSVEAAVADPRLFGAIMVVNTDGSDVHEVETGSRAKLCDAAPEGDAWSPDGRQIVFVRVCFDRKAKFVEGGIWTVNVDGTGAHEIFGNEQGSAREDHRVGWSPDGTSLVFERIDTSGLRPSEPPSSPIGINATAHSASHPRGRSTPTIPTGRLTARSSPSTPPLSRARPRHLHNWPDGTGLAKLTTYNESGQATFHPSWSPDGSRILFSHSPSTGGWETSS